MHNYEHLLESFCAVGAQELCSGNGPGLAGMDGGNGGH